MPKLFHQWNNEMNKHEQAALVRDQHTSGLTNGEATARIVIARFPQGFTADIGSEIKTITDRALAHVIDRLSGAGVEEKYRASFADGFKTGLKNTYSEYALGALALGINKHG
jgi:hypothetical protein